MGYAARAFAKAGVVKFRVRPFIKEAKAGRGGPWRCLEADASQQSFQQTDKKADDLLDKVADAAKKAAKIKHGRGPLS